LKDKGITSTIKIKSTNNNSINRRAISLNKRKIKKEIINPLSIDAIEFDLLEDNKNIIRDKINEEEKNELDVVSVHSVDDLINLNDNKEEEEEEEKINKNEKFLISTNLRPSTILLSNNLHSSPNLTTINNSSINLFNNNNKLINNNNIQQNNINDFKRKNNWETFD
jgi:hypothetical protein